MAKAGKNLLWERGCARRPGLLSLVLDGTVSFWGRGKQGVHTLLTAGRLQRLAVCPPCLPKCPNTVFIDQ